MFSRKRLYDSYYVLGQITEECKRWKSGIYLCYILDLDHLPFIDGGGVALDLLQYSVVQLGGRDLLGLVLVYLYGLLDYLEDPLFLQNRRDMIGM